MKQNAIIYHKDTKDIKAEKSLTKVSLENPILDKDLAFFQKLTVAELKQNIISHYLSYFCENRNSLPEIEIKFIVEEDVKETASIISNDIPAVDKEESFDVYYYKMSSDGGGIEKKGNS